MKCGTELPRDIRKIYFPQVSWSRRGDTKYIARTYNVLGLI